MNHLVEEFRAIEKEIAEEKGQLTLFGLFQREEALGKWDVVVSAPWVSESRREALDYIIPKIRARLSPAEFVSLSRVVPLRPSESFVRELNAAVQVEHGLAELENRVLNGMEMTHAYVITSKPEDKPHLSGDGTAP